MSLLARIVESKLREVEALRVQPRVRMKREPLDVVAALRRPAGSPLRLVAEVKLKSPSAGPLSRALTPAARAIAYASGGATMVSVLCDGPFFDGSWDDLSTARSALDAVPLLAKEFVVDPAQIQEARNRGADAVLLIARIVDADRLKSLAEIARAESIEPLIEVVDEAEVAAAVAAGARVIGVNARDLDTLRMDAARASRVLAAIPEDVVAVHLSGLRSAEDVRRVAATRADAALVGELLMREDDPVPRLRELVAAAAG